MTSTAISMPVAEAVSAGAPRNLGSLAAVVTRRGWGASVERDAERDVWTLLVAPNDTRTASRYAWRAGKWATVNGCGYRETVAWYESATDEAAEAEAPSTAAQKAALDAVKKGADAAVEAQTAAQEAEGWQSGAIAWQDAADDALTIREAEEAAEEAEYAAEEAAKCVKHVKSALRRVKAQRTKIKTATNVTDELGIGDEERREAADFEDTARESLGTAEEAAEGAQEAAEYARSVAERICLVCECLIRGTGVVDGCGCRAVMLAVLDRAGSTVARTVDPEAVRIGYLLDSDDMGRVGAGQLMLAGAWDEAEEMLAEVTEETQEAAEERRTRVASAEITERTLVERYEGRTVREWVEVTDRHAERSTEAYETAREVIRDLDRGGGSLVTDEEYAQMRAAFRRVDRRSSTAHDCDCRARHDVDDFAPVTDPQRAAQWARRAEILADACEADARLVAELLAWLEAEERAAEVIQRAEYLLADAEERYESARRPGAFYDAVGRRIGEASALRAVWGARKALAAVNGSPYLAYPELTDRGGVLGWKVGYCTVHPCTGATGVRIVDSASDEYGAEALAEAKNEGHRERQQRAATEALAVEEAPRYSFDRRDEEGRYPETGGAPAGSPLSRRAHGGRCVGVRAGQTARQSATRQPTRQPTRQASEGYGSRAPPSLVRHPAGRRALLKLDRSASRMDRLLPRVRHGGES